MNSAQFKRVTASLPNIIGVQNRSHAQSPSRLNVPTEVLADIFDHLPTKDLLVVLRADLPKPVAVAAIQTTWRRFYDHNGVLISWSPTLADIRYYASHDENGQETRWSEAVADAACLSAVIGAYSFPNLRGSIALLGVPISALLYLTGTKQRISNRATEFSFFDEELDIPKLFFASLLSGAFVCGYIHSATAEWSPRDHLSILLPAIALLPISSSMLADYRMRAGGRIGISTPEPVVDCASPIDRYIEERKRHIFFREQQRRQVASSSMF